MSRDALIVYGPGIITDTEAGPVPTVPAGWDVVYEDARWCTVWPLGRTARPNVFFHAWLAVRDAAPNESRGCWVCVGPAAIIDALKPRVTRWWETLGALRADNGVIATAIKAAWAGGVGTTLKARMSGFDDDDAEVAR